MARQCSACCHHGNCVFTDSGRSVCCDAPASPRQQDQYSRVHSGSEVSRGRLVKSLWTRTCGRPPFPWEQEGQAWTLTYTPTLLLSPCVTRGKSAFPLP